MRLELSVDDTPFTIILDRDGATVHVEVDGEALEATVDKEAAGRFSVKLGKQRHEVDVPSDHHAVIDGRRMAFRVLAFDARDVGAGFGASDGVVRPPMPGAIARLMVKEGQTVAKGDAMVVLEAMKMQNEITAPFAGVVRRVHVKTGDTVGLEDVVLELEAADA